MTEKSYRITVKVRNANLLRAIEKSGHEPGQKLSDLIGIGYQKLNDLINMKRAPIDANGDLREEVEKICIFLNKMPSELFDFDQMHNPVENNKNEFDADIEEIMALHGPGMDEFEIKRLVQESMSTLTEREQEVLRLRFGFDGGEHTYLECGKELGVGQARARQIETKALRKIRHPSRKERLIGLLDA